MVFYKLNLALEMFKLATAVPEDPAEVTRPVFPRRHRTDLQNSRQAGLERYH
jgi:hypothetical protein